MIFGVGIDIIEVERVMEKVDKGKGFKEKVFSENEILYCEQSINKAENFAVRFAAKEAFLKATGKGLLLGHELCDVEIVPDELGKPELKLHNSFAEAARQNKWNIFHVSLSHIKASACAVVIIES